MKIRNLTPHTVLVLGHEDEPVLSIEPDPAGPARITMSEQRVGAVRGVPTFAVRPMAVSGLPEPEDGTLLIVSSMVLAACPGRTDLIAPYREVRNGAGEVVGCRAFKVGGD